MKKLTIFCFLLIVFNITAENRENATLFPAGEKRPRLSGDFKIFEAIYEITSGIREVKMLRASLEDKLLELDCIVVVKPEIFNHLREIKKLHLSSYLIESIYEYGKGSCGQLKVCPRHPNLAPGIVIEDIEEMNAVYGSRQYEAVRLYLALRKASHETIYFYYEGLIGFTENGVIFNGEVIE
ncbi:MAG: hypothetical protein ABIA04_14475 [Pseudomonadota bacterium]